MMQQRMDMLDSNPEMVEVTSKNYDAAARAAEVLRRHSIMDTAHSPANPATPHPSAPIIASTPVVTGAFPGSSNRHARRSSHLQDDWERQRFLANMMQQRMDMFDSNPEMVEVASKNYDAAARAAEVLRAYHDYVQHGLLEADFDMDTCTITDLDESQLQDDRERQRKQNVNSGIPDLTKVSDADLRRLVYFIHAKTVAHANNLREERENGKGEAYTLNDYFDIVIEFLEENEIIEHAQLHKWSKELMEERIIVLMKKVAEKGQEILQETNPDPDMNAVTIESVAEEEDDTSPATPLRQNSTIDDSGIAEIAQSIPSKTMNGSTPATEDNIGAIFLSRRSQSKQSPVSDRERVERIKEQMESDKISMREAYRNGNPSSITRKRTVSEEVFIAERAALQAKMELQEAKLSAQSDTISQLHSQCACTVCLELAYRPHVLSPCGHVFCARCLVLWFKEALPDEPPFAPYLTEEQRIEEQQRRTLRRKKLCPHCRVR
ncbi:uncharacterized protein FA14DRAFT_181005, partial [Meira miltonrushii]